MASVETRALELFGDALREAPGILHVTAVWQAPDGALRTLDIGPRSPRSRSDRFCLDLARARCDAIVSTGRILRDEPGVRHRLPEDLADWRRGTRGLSDDPVSVVLTGRPDLDLTHPLLAEASRAIVVTGHEAAPAIEARVSDSRITVVARETPSLADTLDFLQAEAGLPSVCIEAGPSSTRALYAAPVRVDELMLSVFCGRSLERGVEGNAFCEPEVLASHFACRHVSRRQEESGPWRFERWLRRS